MNRNQREALEAAEYDMEMARQSAKRRAIQTGRIEAEYNGRPPYAEEELAGRVSTIDGCMAHREQTAGELRAIMQRRENDNGFVSEQVREMVAHYRDQSEEDAARIFMLEQATGEANAAMDAIRNGLRFMQGEWGPLLNAMFERQAGLEKIAHEILTHAMNPEDKPLQAIVERLLRTLRNDHGQGEAGEPKPKLFYCPTCKRHVHPEDLLYVEDTGSDTNTGTGYVHVVSREPFARCPGFVEEREVNKPRLQEAYLEAVDAAFARLGATRTEADAVAIETCRADGVSPEDCAKALYEEALARQ